VTVAEPAARLRRLAIIVWVLLTASVAAWPFAAAGIGPVTTAIAALPLLLPLPGMIRGRYRTLRWASLAMAPALALALTEILVNVPARGPATLTLALILAAFAIIIAALRTSPRSS
jgi:uncharacterized membrane protein